jgi:hypothetical protein
VGAGASEHSRMFRVFLPVSLYRCTQGRPQEILQGGVRSFQPTDERACTAHMLVMEACKISD